MELYYKNETLFVYINMILDEDTYKVVKRRIFKIVDDYGVDHIVLSDRNHEVSSKRLFQRIKNEYHQRYHGLFLIK